MNQAQSDIGRKRQRGIYVSGAAGQRPIAPVGWLKLEAAAQAAMSKETWAYVACGACRETAMEANRASLERWGIVPRLVREVDKRLWPSSCWARGRRRCYCLLPLVCLS